MDRLHSYEEALHGIAIGLFIRRVSWNRDKWVRHHDGSKSFLVVRNPVSHIMEPYLPTEEDLKAKDWIVM
jgi:hypothetical protein